MSRYKIREEQWKKIKGYFPERRSKRGRPRKSNQGMLNAILWIAHSGLHVETCRNVMDPGKQCIPGLQNGEMREFLKKYLKEFPEM